MTVACVKLCFKLLSRGLVNDSTEKSTQSFGMNAILAIQSGERKPISKVAHKPPLMCNAHKHRHKEWELKLQNISHIVMHRKFSSENQKEKIIEEYFVVIAMIEMCFYHLLYRWLRPTLSHYWRSQVCLCNCLCESECWLSECCCCALDMPHFLLNCRFTLFYSSGKPNFNQSYLQFQNFLTSNILYLKGIKILFMTVRCNFKYLSIYFILWGWMS